MNPKQLFSGDDDRGVSPVIGVILMVAITVILAAVIASFVLGLGDADDPAPNPTVETDFSSDELEVSFSGGDDFDAGVATVNYEITVNDTDDDGEDNIAEFLGGEPIDTDEVTLVETDDDDVFADEEQLQFEGVGADAEEVSAGDSFRIFLENDNGELEDLEMEEWDIQVVWDPADQDSEVIVSQSGSN